LSSGTAVKPELNVKKRLMIQLQTEDLNTNHYNQTMMDFLKSVTDTQAINSAHTTGVEGVS